MTRDGNTTTTMAVEPVFLDTCALVAGVGDRAPRAARERTRRRGLGMTGAPLCISPQICREFLVVLTRQPVAGHAFSLTSTPRSTNGGVVARCSPRTRTPWLSCLALARKHQVRGKQIHDCSLVAVVLAHGVSGLLAIRLISPGTRRSRPSGSGLGRRCRGSEVGLGRRLVLAALGARPRRQGQPGLPVSASQRTEFIAWGGGLVVRFDSESREPGPCAS
ncbi:MAG: hypothetical protein MZV70_17220 [Desulfobacterales bacterium]|nr:hypothetical protein [Desulfobacterales bacterium]